jgi:hypothetical protein
LSVAACTHSRKLPRFDLTLRWATGCGLDDLFQNLGERLVGYGAERGGGGDTQAAHSDSTEVELQLDGEAIVIDGLVARPNSVLSVAAAPHQSAPVSHSSPVGLLRAGNAGVGPQYFQSDGKNRIVRTPRKMLVCVNPIAGRRRGVRVWESVEGLFHAANITTCVVVTEGKGHAYQIVRNDPEPYDGIVAVGGDGTFNEVLTGALTRGKSMQEAKEAGGGGRPWFPVPLGIIAAGSDCALAKFVSHLDPSLAAHAIVNNQTRPLDVLHIGYRSAVDGQEHSRFSVCGVAWGIPGQVAKEAEALRARWGVHRYAVSAAQKLFHFRPVRGSIRISPGASVPPSPLFRVYFCMLAPSAHCTHEPRTRRARSG